MSERLRSRLRAYAAELPNALMLAFTTAAVTLMLAVVLSLVLGGENHRHREATRCQAAYIVDIMQEIAETAEIPLTNNRDINTAGIDCAPYLVEPLDTSP